MSATYVNTFASKRIFDPLQEAEEEAATNLWTDVEKCIFLDRFLQFPKDFRRIASFLKNKTTKDCISFYYDSKQTVPYKGALKEHIMRRKRKGDYQVWDASIQAAVSVGATVTAGSSEEKPIVFTIPKSDMTFKTQKLHPLQRDVLDAMVIDEAAAAEYDDSGSSDDGKWKSRKRGRDPLFSLDKKQIKFLRQASQDSMAIQSTKNRDESKSKCPIDNSDDMDTDTPSAPVRKAPQKWTAAEKNTFKATLEEHGRDWAILSKAIRTKTISQIKNYYYDFKKQSGKPVKSDKKGNANRSENASSKSKAKEDQSDETMTTDRSRSPVPGSELNQYTNSHPNSRSRTPPPQLMSNAQAADVRALIEQQRHQDFLRLRQQELSEAIAREAENQANAGRNGGSPVPGGADSIAIQQFLKQHQQQHSQNQQLELLRQEQHLHHQRQQQQHHHPTQSALHQFLARHHQREQSQHQSSLDQQTMSNMLRSWPAPSASQLLQAQNHLHQAQYAAALQQEAGAADNGAKAESHPDLANIQRLLQLRQLQQQNHPMLALSQQQNHGNQLSSLLSLASSTGSGISPSLVAQLESLNGANRNPTDQQKAEISALLNAQSLLTYANGGANLRGGYSAPADRAHSPRNIPQHSGVSETMALVQAAMQLRENGGSQHGFGSPDRRG